MSVSPPVAWHRHFRSKGELSAEVFAAPASVKWMLWPLPCVARAAPASAYASASSEFAARAWHSRRLAFALDRRAWSTRKSTSSACSTAKPTPNCSSICWRRGAGAGEFRVEQIGLMAACLVGAIAEALVGPSVATCSCRS